MSKKDKSDILSGMGSGFQIIKALRDAGASDDQLRAIITRGSTIPGQIVALLKGPTEIKSGVTYSIPVNLTRTLAEMVSAGKYDYANPNIVEKNFPIQRPSVSEDAVEGGPYRTPAVSNDSIKIVLVHLNKVATTTEVLEHMDKLGLRPARIEELLALGEKHPDIQCQFPLVALGSVWVNSDGYRNVACLVWYGSERNLILRWDVPGYRWGEACRFVAVSK